MKILNTFFVVAIIAVCAIAETITIERKIGGFTNTQACVGHEGIIYICDHYKVITYDPITNSFLDTLNLGEYVRNIDFEDDLAVVAGLSNVFLVDATNPSALIELDSEPVGIGSMGWDVEIVDSMAFVAAQNRAIIFDISSTSLALRGSFVPSIGFAFIRSVAVNGSIMYLGESNSGIYAVDVSNPATPVHRTTGFTPGNKIGLEVIPDDKLLVADGAYTGMDSTSLRIFSIPAPITLTETGAWVQLGGDALKTYTPAPYNRAALADGEGGVKIVDISDPTSPYLVVQKTTTDMINGIFVSNDTIFAAGKDTFYVMTTDAFVPDTILTHDPAVIDSVWPSFPVISSCYPYFEWFYTIGSMPLDISTLIIDADGSTFTGFDFEVSIIAGSVTLDLDGYPYTTGDSIVATLTTLSDEAGSSAVGVGLSSTIVLDFSAPKVSECFPGIGDSVSEDDTITITGEIVDIGPGGLNESSFRVIVNGISYSTSGAFLDYTAPDFECNPMGSFSAGDSVEVCVEAEDIIDICEPNELDTCWTFFIRGTGIGEFDRPDEFTSCIYPNPFNAAVSIRAEKIVESVKIYDATGRIVHSISPSEFCDGLAVWKPSTELASGLYLAILPNNKIVKAILLR